MGVSTFVQVPFSGWVIDHFPQRYDACGTSVDAKCAACANVVVNDEDCVISWVETGQVGVDCFVDRLDRHIPDAFPGANINTTLALDAFGLVDIDELLRFHCSG